MYKSMRNVLALFICITIFAISNASAYEYSVTVVEDYEHDYLPYIDDLTPYGQEEYERIEYWLHDVAGWSEEFYEKDASVDEADFGTSNSGYNLTSGQFKHIFF